MATKKGTGKGAGKCTRRPTAKQMEARRHASRQVKAILLLAISVFLFCVAVIKGQNVWTWLHDTLLGIFSFSAYIFPLFLGTFAILLALDKDKSRLSLRVWECSIFIVMLNSTAFAFTGSDSLGYFDTISLCFTAGQSCDGGGALGTLLGYPVLSMFGATGAKVFLIILMVVFLMLATGTTILSVLRVMRRPAEKTKEVIEHAITQTAERQEARRKKIDIDMGDGYARNRRKGKEEQDTEEGPADEPAPEETAEPVNEKLEALERSAGELSKSEETVSAEDVKAAEEEFAEEMAAESDRQEEAKAIYRLPPLTLLEEPKPGQTSFGSEAERRANGELLVNTLKDFGISTRLVDITSGPAVTRYELEPSAGVKISRITGLADDIALRLATTGVRIEAPIPNKAAVGIEVPNKARRTVCLRGLLDSAQFRGSKGKLTVALGQDIEGNTVLTDLAKMPHLLIAGTTGSGKSVCTNSMIQSVLFRATPDEVKMILIDPKKVEFGVYNGVPHLLVPVVTDPHKAAGALSWAVNEMLKRYQMFAEANVRDIGGYNELAQKDDSRQPLPLVLIVIDELADLMMAAANAVEDSICRLAQMARAAGMHMVIATQRPSVDVITGLIKANIPSRLALTVASAVDSRTILDAGGAERLLGYGDMLFMPVGQSKPRRLQGCFVTNQEIERVIDFLKNADQPTEYDQDVIDEIEKQAAAAGRNSRDNDDNGDSDEADEALPQAIEIAVEAGQISTSMLQRKMRFGYARAGRIIDQMEQRGIVGPSEGSKPRKVLITRQQWIERNMNSADEEQ
ncbi:MAG: DNA translocase FtsK [Ruminococcaceae bacterium]|nr:DNA translocase FtsK [Oscillospiraceae bacterium]